MNLRPLFNIISPPSGTLILCLALLVFSSLITLINPLIAGQLTGHFVGSENLYFDSVTYIVLLWASLLALRAVLSFATSYTTGSAAESVLARLRSRLYEHMQLLPMKFFDDQKRGNLLSVLTTDSAIISNFITGTLIQILPSALTFIGAAGMMLWLNTKLGLVVIALLPLYALAMKILGRRIRPLSREWVDAYGNMVSLIEENLGLLPVIKSYTREQEEFRSFSQKNDHLLGLSKRQLLIHTLLPPTISMLTGIGLLLLVWLGYKDIQSGTTSPEEVVSLLFYALLLNQPLSTLANIYGQLQRTRGASERILSFLGEHREPSDEGLPTIGSIKGKIEFNEIRFCYGSGGEATLSNLSLAIRPNETVAIVGPNGAGKSTLAHLLMRLLEPTAGQILIDDQDISLYSTESVRQKIGLVAQQTLLLNATVAENIAWGKAFAERAEIESAARAAKAHDFITGLPDGYDTVIGDQGLKLSGGQRQRLSLARALLKDPPILILDEATSMFDPAAEASFLRDCRELFAKRTVILITHRPASLAIANRVLLMKDGKLSEVNDVEHYLRSGETNALS